MKWKVEFSPDAKKELSRLDRYTQRLIGSWIDKHLANCENPRVTGKPLRANLAGYWRYRIGDYRMICKLEDDRVIIIVIKIGHRRDVYE